MKKAIYTIFIAKYYKVIINLLINIVLARYISPEEYGIATILFVFVSFINVVSDIGVGSAVVQNRELNHKEINSLFTLTFYFSLILAFFFCLLMLPFSWFYENNIYISLGWLLAISVFFTSMNVIPDALVMKEKKFFEVAKRTTLSSTLSGGVSILIAVCGGGYYALIVQAILNAGILLIWNWNYTKPKLIRNIDFSVINKVKDFSTYWYSFNLLNYLARNLDNLLIGKFIGTSSLAYYDKAYKLMLYPVQNLTYVLNPIMHPVMSEKQEDRKYIYEKYIKVLKVLSLIGVFITAFCSVASYEIILIIFGKQWEAAVLSFQILSYTIWFQLTNSTSGAIYASLNKTKVLFKSGCIYISIQIFLFIIAVINKRIEYVAVASAIGLIIKWGVDFFVLITKGFGLPMKSFMKNFISDFLILILCCIGIKMLCVVEFNSIVWNFLYKFIVCIFVYGFILSVFKKWKCFKILF